MALDGQGAMAGAAAGSSFGPWGAAIGGVAGGLGLFGGGGGGGPAVVPPERINQYHSAFGTATPEGVTRYEDPNQSNIDMARQGTTDILAGGLGAGDARLNEFQNAYFDARSPELERNIALQQQQQNIQSATRGTTGSSSDLFREALSNQQANEQRGNLLNQAIQGRENLANQALNQDLARAQYYGGVTQQGFNNQMGAAQFGANSLAQSQGSANAFSNAASGVAAGNAAIQNQNLANTIGMAQVAGNVGQNVSNNWNAFGSGNGSTQNDYTGSAYDNWVAGQRGQS